MIRTILVDDMPKARRVLRRMLEKIEGVEIVAEMGNAIEAIQYVETHEVDLVFMDIEMPGMLGMEGTKRISEMENPPLIIFVTAYMEYMLDAWKTQAIYYIVKPYLQEDVEEAIQKYKLIRHKDQRFTSETKDEVVKVSCFPIFRVEKNGIVVHFSSKRSKELMAYLIHCKGGWVDNADICAHVLEGMDEEKAKNNLRTYIRRLKLTLEAVGAAHIIEQSYGKIRINTENVECDYYQYLVGKTELFEGEYLREYSWAEPTVAVMFVNLNKNLFENKKFSEEK